jgi:hypothetical protein
MRRVTLLMPVVILAGCGRTEPLRSAAGSQSVLDAGGEPHCDRDGGTPVLMQTALPNQARAHWGQLDACVNVTYEVELEAALGDLRVALSDWSYPPCTWMCFTAPVPQEDRPTRLDDRRIHLSALKKSDEAPGFEKAGSVVKIVDEEIVNATILIRPDLAEPGQAPLLTLVGQVLGFVPTAGVDSTLNDRTGVSMTLTVADEQSVCAVYPTCR